MLRRKEDTVLSYSYEPNIGYRIRIGELKYSDLDEEELNIYFSIRLNNYISELSWNSDVENPDEETPISRIMNIAEADLADWNDEYIMYLPFALALNDYFEYKRQNPTALVEPPIHRKRKYLVSPDLEE